MKKSVALVAIALVTAASALIAGRTVQVSPCSGIGTFAGSPSRPACHK